jgi:hypothetical protein
MRRAPAIQLTQGNHMAVTTLQYAAYFLGGAFLTNAVPHFVNGVMGRPFQSPFAKPRGVGREFSRRFVIDR